MAWCVVRILAVLMILVILVLGSTNDVQAQQQPDHPLWDVPVHQFNICGNVCNDGVGVGRHTDLVMFFVGSANPRPWLVTLNELCTPQWERIANRLVGEYGYFGVFVVTDPDPPDPCGVFGNAMFAAGSPTDAGLAIYYNRQSEDDLGRNERRALLCERMEIFLGVFTGCVTHLTNDETDIAQAQARQGRRLEDQYGAGVGRYMGGDFNLRRPPEWFDFYWEVDPLLRNTIPAHAPRTRIDHIFADRQHPQGNREAPNPFCDPNASDHCYTSGTYHVG